MKPRGRLIDWRSLRIRVLLTAAISIGLVLAVAGASLTVLFETHIQRQIAAELEVFWSELAGAIEFEPDGGVALTRRLADPRYEAPLSGLYWQIQAADGTLVRSRSLWDGALVLPADAPSDVAFEAPGVEPGSVYYYVSRPVRFEATAGPATAIVSVAFDHALINALSDAYAADLTIALLAIAAALFLGAILQAQVGLQPLSRLRQAIAGVHSGRLDRMGAGYPTEIQPLVEDLDRMLDWRDEAIAKARDRAGALAHGFKTPLTILMLEARKLAEQGQASSAAAVRDQAETMHRLVEREMARARVRGSGTRFVLPGAAAVDLGGTVERIAALVRRMPRAEQLSFDIAVEPGLRTHMDQDDLAEIVGNLLDNARKWAAERVEVRVVREAARIVVQVSDDGPGFGAEAQPDGTADGAGLGLTIVEDVLDAYGSRLVRERRDDRTIFSFEMPLPVQSILRPG